MSNENTYTSTSSTQRTTSADNGGSTVDEAKGQAQELSNKAQQKAGEAAEKVKQSASNLAEDTRHKVNEYANEAKDTARSAAEQRKDQAASRLEGVASGLREAGNKFHEEDEDIFARYADSAASSVEEFSDYLRTHSTGDLLHEVEGFARRQPEVFLAGALAAGFFLGRFFKSSGRRSYGGNFDQRYNQQNWRSDSPYAQSGNYGYGRNPQAGSYREQTPASSYAGTSESGHRFYQEAQYSNRPHNESGANERIDTSSAVGSTGTVSRTWDSTDVDSVEDQTITGSESSTSRQSFEKSSAKNEKTSEQNSQKKEEA